MKKGYKIFATILIIPIVLISFSFIYILFFRPSPSIPGPQSNTYVENSSIDFLEYAVKFTYGDVVISNFLNITSGKVNGYPIVNSTDCINCTINNATRLLSISLHNDVKLSLKSINYTGLIIYLHDESSLIVENCTFEELRLFDYSSAIIKNSSINYIAVSPPYIVPGVFYYQTSLSIINNSTIHHIEITEGCDLFIKDCKLPGIESIFIETTSPLIKITGTIENSTLQSVTVKGYANLSFYGSILENLDVYDMTRVILDQCTVTSHYYYGIVAYSGTTNIDGGKITGTNYINNTRLINSVVTTPLLVSVATNSSAVVNMNNFSCSVYLHDNSRATIANLTDSSLTFTHFSVFCGTLRDSSFLTLENNDFSHAKLRCFDNSELIMINTKISDLDCDTTNSITINNCDIYSISTYYLFTNLARDNIYIANSFINDLSLGGRDVAYVENCTIRYLNEGVIIYDGSLNLGSGGFTGTGSYVNFTTLVNIIFSQRVLRLIEINGTARLTIKDYYVREIFCINDSELILKNASVNHIVARDSAKINVDKCYGIWEVYLLEDSILEIIQIDFIFYIYTMGNSFVSVTNSTIYVILAFQSSRVSFHNSYSYTINVFGSNKNDYAFKAYDSIIKNLSIYTWS